MRSASLSPISEAAWAIHPWILEHRRFLHRHPELSFQEEKTSEYLQAQLKMLGMTPIRVAQGRHGFYADLIAPSNPHRFVALRADMDALPIEEETGLSFSSQVKGIGHLCGHDAHCAMLLGAARILEERQSSLPYSIRFFFQHAEEVSPGGAVDFVRAGALDHVDFCFGLHVRPKVPVGQISVRTGPQMAGTTGVKIVVKGRGGHAAAPHDTTDPVLAAAAIIVAAQQLVSRRNDPFEAAVVSICTVHAGTANNVIPEEVEMTGTIRSFNLQRLRDIADHLRDIVRHTAAAYRCEGYTEIEEGYPPLVNDPEAADLLRRAASGVLGRDKVRQDTSSMGGEDFAYYCLERPSAFGFLGVAVDGDPQYPLHHPKFHPAEDALWRGAAILASVPFTVAERRERMQPDGE